MDTRTSAERNEMGTEPGTLRTDFDSYENASEVRGLLTGQVVPDGGGWRAFCRELGLTARADTEKAALARLDDAIRTFFADGIEDGTLGDSLSRLGWQCNELDGHMVACPADAIPERLLPDCTIDPVQQDGALWSRWFRFRERTTPNASYQPYHKNVRHSASLPDFHTHYSINNLG